MPKLTRRLLAALLVGLLVAAAFVLGFTVGHQPGATGRSASSASFTMVEEARDRILSSAERPVSDQDLAEGAVRGMLAALGDRYARFYTVSGFRDLRAGLDSQFSGVGVWLRQQGQTVEVTAVLSGSPAAGAGLREGDLVTAFGNAPVTSMLDLMAKVRMTAPGTRVELEVFRDGVRRSVSVVLGRQ
jgi:carboxyl-terminal processing protease